MRAPEALGPISGTGRLAVAPLNLNEVVCAVASSRAFSKGQIRSQTVASSGRSIVRLMARISAYLLFLGPVVHFRAEGSCIYSIMELRRGGSLQDR